jgi:hypothetical protein
VPVGREEKCHPVKKTKAITRGSVNIVKDTDISLYDYEHSSDVRQSG